MPRTEEANQQIRAERRGQIIHAAASVFARKGLASATITDIAAQAGISHGLLYRHFASKEEVFAAIVDQAADEAIRLAQTAQAQPGTAWERIRWISERIFPGASLGRRPDYFFIVLYALTNEDVPASVREQAARQGKIIYDVMYQFIAEGQEAGDVVAGDSAQITTLYLSCIQGLVLRGSFSRHPGPTFPSIEMLLGVLKAGR
ncbi:MAG TPA: TetR/AcrR family transcriptional regulator [Ktedonobacteraceae bacterium]|nr:TetR/AcrR family transcriptional regulator [Ktedonobacteraceae bacterium]